MQSIFNSTMMLLAQSTMFFAKLKFRIWFDLSCNSRADNQPLRNLQAVLSGYIFPDVFNKGDVGKKHGYDNQYSIYHMKSFCSTCLPIAQLVLVGWLLLPSFLV